MSSTAIKISSELANAARIAAEAAHRSLTGQIEHWASVGRGVEGKLTTDIINLIKKPTELTTAEEQEEIQKALAALEELQSNTHYSKAHQYFRENNLYPLYEADPADPNQIVEVHADGTRVKGKLVNRTFVKSA